MATSGRHMARFSARDCAIGPVRTVPIHPSSQTTRQDCAPACWVNPGGHEVTIPGPNSLLNDTPDPDDNYRSAASPVRGKTEPQSTPVTFRPTPISSSRPGGHLRTPKDSYGHFGAPYGPIFGPELCHRTPSEPCQSTRPPRDGTSREPTGPLAATVGQRQRPCRRQRDSN